MFDIDGRTNGTGMSVHDRVHAEFVIASRLRLLCIQQEQFSFQGCQVFFLWGGRRACSVSPSRKRLERNRHELIRYGLVEEVNQMAINNSGERLWLH